MNLSKKNNVDSLLFIPFIFIRHGETDWNKQGKIMGHHDISLNDKGKKQASYVYSKLKMQKIDKIFYSPLSRAQETAVIINSDCKLKMICIDDLKEWHWGILEGMNPEKGPDLNSKYYQGKTLKEWTLNPEIIKAEPEISFFKRVSESLKNILTSSRFPLIVSHGGVFKSICKILDVQYQPLDNCVPILFLPQNSDKNHEFKWKSQILK